MLVKMIGLPVRFMALAIASRASAVWRLCSLNR
jgi:hypothetical protein